MGFTARTVMSQAVTSGLAHCRTRVICLAVLAGAVVLGVAGCSQPSDTQSATQSTAHASMSASTQASTTAEPPSTGSSSTDSSGSTVAGVTLASLGFQNGPEGFLVPQGLTFSQRVDQENVVTLIVPVRQGQGLLDFLNDNLGAQGYQIEGSSDDSLVFSSPDWEGAFTMSDEQAGLTLRALN